MGRASPFPIFTSLYDVGNLEGEELSSVQRCLFLHFKTKGLFFSVLFALGLA